MAEAGIGAAVGGTIGGLFQVGLSSQAWKNAKNSRRWWYKRHKENLKHGPERVKEGLIRAGYNPMLPFMAPGGMPSSAYQVAQASSPGAASVGAGGFASAGAAAGKFAGEKDVRNANIEGVRAGAHLSTAKAQRQLLGTSAEIDEVRARTAASLASAKQADAYAAGAGLDNQLKAMTVKAYASDKAMRDAAVTREAMGPGWIGQGAGILRYMQRSMPSRNSYGAPGSGRWINPSAAKGQ